MSEVSWGWPVFTEVYQKLQLEGQPPNRIDSRRRRMAMGGATGDGF